MLILNIKYSVEAMLDLHKQGLKILWDSPPPPKLIEIGLICFKTFRK